MRFLQRETKLSSVFLLFTVPHVVPVISSGILQRHARLTQDKTIEMSEQIKLSFGF